MEQKWKSSQPLETSSFALSALSFLMHDMSRLRMIAIISALFGIFYNYNVTDSPLWLVIFWLSTFLGINLSMLATEYFRNNLPNLMRTSRSYLKLFSPSSAPLNSSNSSKQDRGRVYAAAKDSLVRDKKTLNWVSFGEAKQKY